MAPSAESGEAVEPRRTPTDLARALGIDDPVFAAELFSVSGGVLSLARTAAGLAARTDFAVDLSSPSFAAVVADQAPRLCLGISPTDERAAALLAHLSSFTHQTALMALSTLQSDHTSGVSAPDPEGILLRLRMLGVLVPIGERGRGRLLEIPLLIAAKLRADSAADRNAGDAVIDLAAMLVNHLEAGARPDADVLSDALALARRFGLWSLLSRIRDAVGLPAFLLTPAAACTAFGHLPAAAPAADPGLVCFSALAEVALEFGGDDPAPERLRAAVIAETGPRRMRLRLPGEENGASGSIGVIGRMLGLAEAGLHAEAATLGLAESAGPGVARARLVIRLLTAIALFHAADPARAISILHDIEARAEIAHVDGDFLLPATSAWTALCAATGGDHERADEHLRRIIDEAPEAVMLDELVRPAWHVAAALRAFDRLDLGQAREELDFLTSYPENRSLGVYRTVIRRTLAILSATEESGLLFAGEGADDLPEAEAEAESLAGRDLLAASRCMVFIGLGQLKWADLELDRLSSDSDARILLGVRSKLVAGLHQEAITDANTWFYHRSLTPKSRAELSAIRAAALLRTGDSAAASAEFVTAIGLSAWVNSLLPLAFLPQGDRRRLINLTAGAVVWEDASAAFSGHFGSGAELIDRLRTIGAVSVDEASIPQLSMSEVRLLDLLHRGLSIAEISVELSQVTGTVKNRLSTLYRKFGVSSRSAAIARARSLGFLSPR